MNELALFAGAGGGLLASKWLLGHQIICYIEKDPYCVEVLKARIRDGFLDEAPIWDDARTFNGKPWHGVVDCISAGFPCQPFSITGKQEGEKSKKNLWPDTIRIIGETKPNIVFLENVPVLIGFKYFGQILGDLSKIGYDAKWTIVSAEECGAPHLRKRLWIYAYNPDRGNEETFAKMAREKQKADPDGVCSKISDTSKQRRFKRTIQKKGRSLRLGGWWSVEPDMGRTVDGVAFRVDRLKAIGNGQVPIVAQKAWKILNKCSR